MIKSKGSFSSFIKTNCPYSFPCDDIQLKAITPDNPWILGKRIVMSLGWDGVTTMARFLNHLLPTTEYSTHEL